MTEYNAITEAELDVLHGISERGVVQTAVEAAEGQYVSVPATATTVDVYRYDGMRWRRDMGQRLRNRFLPWVVRQYQDHIASEIDSGKFDERTVTGMRAFSHSLDDLPRFNRIVDATRTALLRDDLVLDPASAPDPDDRSGEWLFNTRSGTYDLLLDEMRPHDPADYLTQVAPVYYDPEATCPRFDAFLDEILPDKAVADFVLELFAYAMNAQMGESVFPIFHGTGANGKSTLTEVIFGIFGTHYTGSAEGNLFEAVSKPGGAPSPERMAMRNKRVVFAKESAESMELNAQMVKEFTSVEVVSGRHLYHDPEEFKPTHTAFLITNHMPDIGSGDDGIWRRVLEIPFETKIPYARQRKGLHEELLGESSGIFNRLLAAHRRWLGRGRRLDIPEAVQLATDAYRADSDPLEEFVDDTFDFSDPTARMTSSAIYRQYEAFAERSGERPMTLNKFIPWLRRGRGLVKYNSRGQRGLEGIKLADHSGPSDPPPNDPTPPPDAPYPDKHEVEIWPAGRDTLATIKDGTMGRTGWGATTNDVYVDVETTGLNPKLDRVRLVQVSDGGPVETFDVFDEAQYAAARAWLCDHADHTFVAHNAAFDLAFLEGSLGYEHQGDVFCTMTAAQIANAGHNMPKPAPKYIEYYYKNGNPKMKSDTPFSLRSVVFRELDRLLDKDMQTSDWSAEELTDEQIAYARTDVEVLIPLTRMLRAQISDVGTVDLDMDNVKVAARTWLRGVKMDVERWQEIADENAGLLDTIDGELDNLASYKYGPGSQRCNWNAPAQRRALVAAFGHEIPDAQADTIKRLADVNEAAALLTRRAEVFKLATTYGDKFLERVDAEGRIRTTYKVAATHTGRFSSSPNLQNIPRDGDYRECFVPDPGTVFVGADWSQIEVRLIAAASGDEALQDALATGDVYTATARKVMGVEDVSKADRQRAKAIVLGFQYGMGVDKFKDYARDTFGVMMTRDEAQEYKRRFFEAYPKLKSWQRDTGDPFDYDTPSNTPTHNRTYLGRVRHAITSYTERLNTPIQAAGADALKLALVELHKRGVDIAMHIHDEIVIRCSPDEAEIMAGLLTDVMQHAALAAQDPGARVPVPVEANVGTTWAATKS